MRNAKDNYPGLIPLGGGLDKYMQIGRSAFATDDTSVAVRTQLKFCDFAIAGYLSGVLTATDTAIAIACSDEIASGAITFHRQKTGAADEAGTAFWYMLIGTVNETD